MLGWLVIDSKVGRLLANEIHSTIPSTKAALKSLLDTAMASLSVQVQYADNPEQARTERVWLGPTEIGDDEPRALTKGRRKLRESYLHNIMVEVTSKVTAEASELRVFVIAEAIEDAIALDSTLGDVDNLLWAVVEGKELETTETGERPLTTLNIRVRCVADMGRV